MKLLPKVVQRLTGQDHAAQHYQHTVEYLRLLQKHHALTLKRRCFIALITAICTAVPAGATHLSDATKRQLRMMPQELREELIHFMMEFRLLNYTSIGGGNSSGGGSSSKVTTASLSTLLAQLADDNIHTLDFRIVRSKISQCDATKELLRTCRNIHHLDFSFCYDIDDSVLKILLMSNGVQHQSQHQQQQQQQQQQIESTTAGLIMSPSKKGGVGASESSSTSTSTSNSNNSPSTSSTSTSSSSFSIGNLKNKLKKKMGMSSSDPVIRNPGGGGGNHSMMSNHSGDLETTSSASSSNTSSLLSIGLESLSIRHCTTFSDAMLRKLFKASPSLTSLDVSGTKVSAKTLLTITSKCKAIRSLSIGRLSCADILTPKVTATFCNLSSLTNLDLGHLPGLDGRALISMLSNPTKSIHVSSSASSTSSSAHARRHTIASSSTMTLSSNLSSNISSNISTSTSSMHTSKLDDANHYNQSIYPANIQSLNMAQTLIDDETLSSLPNMLPQLHSLDISFCSRVGDDGMLDLATNGLTSLTHLACQTVKASDGLLEVLKCNPCIHYLDISFAQVKDKHLRELPHHINSLRTLKLDGLPITDNVFNLISKANQCLEVVSLSQCSTITFELFNVLADNCPLLRKLYMSHSRIGPVALDKITRFFDSATRLKTLNIAFSNMVTDDIVTALSKSRCAANLESLFIGGGFQQLENASMHALIDTCPNIRIFSCISCYNITDTTVRCIMKKWLLLEALELTDCIKLSLNTVNYLTLDTHLHFHLRFIFFGSAICEEVNEQSIINKIEGKTTIELLETQQLMTLEDLILQGWIKP
ncbi:hypothetical protein SAMD00019534_019200 [Acytostelium subglobosum LB1]|uniref:hypothetical protein n=1 Tax=Acytostelium subglobosum LB1 TaxID=1410327 RepID=UPI0006447EEC|nr:hypothetical protein SAMD00019534_019200 [Acytostelium subglobosum LB1]GAM18745.1 hypothetical protein SAMD00019534_019200 [Acytostelium subglobosum LB1]|eukprot:XP_012757965.1 hypothetical protein SAMD00019534_019200 [Acytostelium subglobosum LB1]